MDGTRGCAREGWPWASEAHLGSTRQEDSFVIDGGMAIAVWLMSLRRAEKDRVTWFTANGARILEKESSSESVKAGWRLVQEGLALSRRSRKEELSSGRQCSLSGACQERNRVSSFRAIDDAWVSCSFTDGCALWMIWSRSMVSRFWR